MQTLHTKCHIAASDGLSYMREWAAFHAASSPAPPPPHPPHVLADWLKHVAGI